MLLETLSTPFFKARSVNQTSTSFVSKLATATEPRGDAATATGASVQELTGATVSQNGIMVCPYGTGTNNQTFNMRVLGWRSVGTNVQTKLWIPVLLCQFACTLSSTLVGVATKVIVATELFADTLTLTYGNDDISVDIVSPANDLPAHALVDVKGCQKLELTFETGSSATDCNCLIAFL